jgi:hypothetical protein
MPGLDWHGVEDRPRTGKSFLLGLVVFLALLCLIGGLIYWLGESESGSSQDVLYASIAQGNAAAIYDQMYPELQSRVDMPVLRAWVAAAAEHLDALRSGRTAFQIEMVGDRIRQLKPDSGPLADWKPRPDDPDAYRTRTQKLLASYLIGSDRAAWQSLPAEYSARTQREDFLKDRADDRQELGTLKDIEFVQSRLDRQSDPIRLILQARLTGSAGRLKATIVYEFVGLQARLARLEAVDY